MFQEWIFGWFWRLEASSGEVLGIQGACCGRVGISMDFERVPWRDPGWGNTVRWGLNPCPWGQNHDIVNKITILQYPWFCIQIPGFWIQDTGYLTGYKDGGYRNQRMEIRRWRIKGYRIQSVQTPRSLVAPLRGAGGYIHTCCFPAASPGHSNRMSTWAFVL